MNQLSLQGKHQLLQIQYRQALLNLIDHYQILRNIGPLNQVERVQLPH